ncbi:hypothetical protein GCM10027298_22340 [Epidermidibacterium keratini]
MSDQPTARDLVVNAACLIAARFNFVYLHGWSIVSKPRRSGGGSEPETRPDDRGARASRIPESSCALPRTLPVRWNSASPSPSRSCRAGRGPLKPRAVTAVCLSVMMGHHCQLTGPHVEHEARYIDATEGNCVLRWRD